MRGFQPQHFADGGLVQGVKRLFGMDEERNARIAAYRAERAQEKAQQAAQGKAQQAQQPAPAKAISDYSGMSAMQRREKAAGLADGGMVRGPGTGTSDDVPDEVPEGTYIMPADSTQALGPDKLAAMGARGFSPGGKQPGKKVPVNLSNGEFKMPPEQVHAIGVQALDQAKNATHQPVRGFAPKARPEEPRQFFADGGGVRPYRATGVDDEFMQSMAQSQNARRQQANATASEAAAQSQADSDAPRLQNGYFPNNSPDAGKNIYAGAGPANGFGSSGKLASGAADVIGAQPPVAKFQPIPVRAPAADPSRAQAAAAPPPVQPAQPAVQPAEQPTPAAATPGIGQLHSAGSRSGGQMLADGLTSGARSFFDSFQKGPEPAATPSPAGPRGMPGYKTDVQRGGGNVPAIDTAAAPAPAATSAQAPAVAPGPGDVTRVGNSYSGTNVSGNISINGQAPRNGGQVSAQNMAAADGLAARSQQESMARVTAQPAVGFQPAGVTAPTVRHSGNDWQTRNELRNAQVSAGSIMNNGGKWDQHKGVSPERAYAAALEGADIAARTAQPGVDVAAMRENAGIQREGMQQSGATERSARGFAVDQQRIGIEGRRVDSETEARGLQVRQAQQQEQLRNTLIDPNATPQQKAQAQAALQALSGKGDSWKAVALQGGTDAQGNKTESILGAVNERTGEMKRMDQGGGNQALPLPQNPSERQDGKRYTLPNGSTMIWSKANSGWLPA